jgi:hypothetical protein
MSFDIFVQWFHEGDAIGADGTLVREIIRAHAVSVTVGKGFWNVAYADGGAQIFGPDDHEIDSLMINQAGGDIFFTTLLELAARTRGVIFWPSDGPCIAVADPKTIKDLPAEMVENSGPAYVVRTGKELSDFIYGGILPKASGHAD